MLSPGDKIGLLCCSNGLPLSFRPAIKRLDAQLREMGLFPVYSPFLYEDLLYEPEKKAEILMEFFLDQSIRAIFDLSGGDLASGLLDYLDFEKIKSNKKPFFGCSDLTALLNPLCQKAGIPVFYYQLRHLAVADSCRQKQWFSESLMGKGTSLFQFSYTFLQGAEMNGPVLGGNARCLLKLAGTPYFPKLDGAILFLEARSGTLPFLSSLITQYGQMGVFQKIEGLLLGQFTAMDQSSGPEAVETLVQNALKDFQVPIARTFRFGHSEDAGCLALGRKIYLTSRRSFL